MGTASTDQVYFEKADRKSAIEFQLTTPDYPLTTDNAGAMATGIIKALKQKRQQEGHEMVMPPTVEKDRRFQVLIHEKYKVNGATVDTLHLLKLVGSRTVMVVASTGRRRPDRGRRHVRRRQGRAGVGEVQPQAGGGTSQGAVSDPKGGASATRVRRPLRPRGRPRASFGPLSVSPGRP